MMGDVISAERLTKLGHAPTSATPGTLRPSKTSGVEIEDTVQASTHYCTETNKFPGHRHIMAIEKIVFDMFSAAGCLMAYDSA